MKFFAHVLCLLAVTAAVASAVAHPNDSMFRERIPPTPYGQRLARTGLNEVPVPGPWQDAVDQPIEYWPEARARYLAAIDSAEQARGAYSPDLVEPLASAAQAFQSAQDHAEAISYFRRALHLSRVNEGLYCANQIPILNGMIRSQMALGNLSDADEMQQYRFRVQQHAFSDDVLQLRQATLEYIEWQHQLYLSGLGGDTYRRLLKMHQLQTSIIEQLEAEGGHQPELISSLYQRLETEYLLADYSGEKQAGLQVSIGRGQVGPSTSTDLEQQEFRMIKNNCFRSGVKTLKQVVELTQGREPMQVEEAARALIALGDWYLWWNWDARALQKYRKAYALYANDDDPLTDPQELFREPVELPEDPVFRPALHTPSDRSDARAVVSLSVSQLGQARDIEILELDAEDSRGARVSLFKMLREVRFRPLVVDGQVVAASSLVREYRFDH